MVWGCISSHAVRVFLILRTLLLLLVIMLVIK